MIDEKRIREIAMNHNTFLKGNDLFYTNKVKLVSKINKDDKVYYRFKVNSINAMFTIKDDIVTDVNCKCGEQEVCKEVVACLLYIVNNDPSKRLEILLKNTKGSISQ